VVQGSDRMLYACMIICRCSEGGWTPQGRFLALLLDFDGHQKYSRWAPAGFPESPQLSRNFDGLYFIFANQFWGLRYLLTLLRVQPLPIHPPMYTTLTPCKYAPCLQISPSTSAVTCWCSAQWTSCSMTAWLDATPMGSTCATV
jgi:hypothetical protein